MKLVFIPGKMKLQQTAVWVLVADDDGHVAGVFQTENDALEHQLILEEQTEWQYHAESSILHFRDKYFVNE